MTKILITGATGNVGIQVIKALQNISPALDIYAGVRNVSADKLKLAGYKISYSHFDFEDTTTYKTALQNCDILFLLRPPQISAVDKYFKPIIETCKASAVKHIVFLSVQGVEKSKIIPQHKIEKIIVESGIPFTFLRPAYFMQNFITTLKPDLIKNNRIYLPAGEARFTIIDVEDVGNVAAKILADPTLYINKRYELTNNEILTFKEMANKLSKGLNRKIKFVSPNLLQFYFTKRKENMPPMFIFVMIMLHYFPRFQKPPAITNIVKIITGKEPKTFDQFIIDNRLRLQ